MYGEVVYTVLIYLVTLTFSGVIKPPGAHGVEVFNTGPLKMKTEVNDTAKYR